MPELHVVVSRRATDALIALMRGELSPLTHYRRVVGYMVPLPTNASELRDVCAKLAQAAGLSSVDLPQDSEDQRESESAADALSSGPGRHVHDTAV